MSNIPVLFLPGLGGDMSGWEAVINELPDTGYRYYKISIPEYGCEENGCRFDLENAPEFLENVIKELRLSEQVVLAGHSLGGLISLRYSVAFPDRVKALILLSTPLKSPDKKVPLYYRFLIFLGLHFPWLEKITKLLSKYITNTDTYKNKPSTASQFMFFQRVKLRNACRCYADTISKSLLQDVEKVGGTPVLLIYGKKDNIMLSTTGIGLYERFANKTIVSLDTNHYIPKNKPKEVAGLIVNFLARL